MSQRSVSTALTSLLANVQEAAQTQRLPQPMRLALEAVLAQLQALQMQIGTLEKDIQAQHRTSEASRRLETIPGIGPFPA